MNPSDLKDRFDELCAGRALGDLSPDEERELAALCERLGVAADADFDWLAATLETGAVRLGGETMPSGLASVLHRWAEETESPPAPNLVRPRVAAWRTVIGHPVSGWTAAAAVLILSLLLTNRDQTPPPDLAEGRLRAEAVDLVESNFSGLGDFASAGGKVVWSDSLQRGFMTLNGIPANDPKHAQYQLWIVDPARDADAPVDGGVFDIPAGTGSVVVPINAKLAIRKPQAFVITLEQPGGVVKSKQEKVVALAKN